MRMTLHPDFQVAVVEYLARKKHGIKKEEDDEKDICSYRNDFVGFMREII